jgi:hypothetical protein
VVTEYKTGTDSAPFAIAAGPDGNIWFTEAEAIAKITPAGVVTKFGNKSGSSITAGSDGNLWFTAGDKIRKITPTGVVTEYPVGIDSGATEITAGPDGNLWFTELDGIGKVTPAGVVTEYRAGLAAYSARGGIAAGPDGNLWFTEESIDTIEKITPAGVVTAYSLGAILAVAVTGKGRITGGGIHCPVRCWTRISVGATLTLRASAARGYRFAGWSGGCTGLETCTIHPIATVKKVIATFRKRHP